MKTLIAVVLAGILAGAVIERLALRAEAPVVTVGGIESPLPTPRVLVRNLHPAAVEVSYATAGGPAIHRLGVVPALATVTFPLPVCGGPERIVIEARAGHEWFASPELACDGGSEISLEIAAAIGRSQVGVTTLRVIRPWPGLPTRETW
jgi:hypothetical protein